MIPSLARAWKWLRTRWGSIIAAVGLAVGALLAAWLASRQRHALPRPIAIPAPSDLLLGRAEVLRQQAEDLGRRDARDQVELEQLEQQRSELRGQVQAARDTGTMSSQEVCDALARLGR